MVNLDESNYKYLQRYEDIAASLEKYTTTTPEERNLANANVLYGLERQVNTLELKLAAARAEAGVRLYAIDKFNDALMDWVEGISDILDPDVVDELRGKYKSLMIAVGELYKRKEYKQNDHFTA